MFDDQDKNTSTGGASAANKPVEDIFAGTDSETPQNLPVAPKVSNSATASQRGDQDNGRVEDIFATSNASNSPNVTTPRQSVSSATQNAPAMAPTVPADIPDKLKKRSGIGKILAIIIAGLLIIILSGFLAYKLIMDIPTNNNSVSDAEETVNSDVNTNDEQEDVKTNTKTKKTDKATKNTTTKQNDDLSIIDSDGDGLTDEEELQAGTDPKDIDTDNDGLGDREEVQVYDTDPLNADTDDDGYLDGQEVSAGYNPNGSGKLLELPLK
ncbi:hypothetical protein D6827_02030 [Candidatus Parcubacteria bacterium]|nr:MAG: hypothetical protein D6827_02030 [Candidatus Parcubacteria bacterium]